MPPPTEQSALLPAAVAPSVVTVAPKLTGQVVFMYAFDMAYEMIRRPVKELLGQPVAQFEVDASRRMPRQLFFYRPQMVHLPPIERIGPHGQVRLQRTIKLLPVGAISITVSVPFTVQRIEELVAYHDLRFNDGTYLYDHVRDLAESVRKELEAYYVRPVPQLSDEEGYTVFCFASPMSSADGSHLSAEAWLSNHRRSVAALLTEERDPRYLSQQEADESTCKSYSYYQDDVLVMDWDAALLVDRTRNFDEILYILELGNLQLAELEAYDRMLDDAVERAYRDLSGRGWRWGTSAVHRELREIRIDLARLSDELQNITKFFGDWHLARVYQGISARFHLADWHRTIDEKLKTLDDMYQILRSDQNNRNMLVMELTVIILFVIDLLILLVHH